MYNEIVYANIAGMPAKIFPIEKVGFQKGIGSAFHIHDEIELLFVLSGGMRFSFNNVSIDISDGDGIFVNRRVPHSSEILKDHTKNLLIQINVEKLLKSEFRHMNQYLSLIFSGTEKEYFFLKKNSPEASEILYHMQIIESEHRVEKKSFATYIKGELYLLLGALYRYEILNDIEIKYDREGISKIYKALTFVEENYEKPITLYDMSKAVNMNTSYFCRLFKRVTEKTPMEYINYVRIWKAENLLTSTDESILEISLETGFSSVSYFNRVFKKLKGTSPSVYRKIKYLK